MKALIQNFSKPALLLSFALLTACGGGSENAGSKGPAHIPVDNEQGVPTYTFESNPDLEKAVEVFPVSCQGACPESSGTLLAVQGLSLSTCSFSLVGKDIILTNRHCIPTEIAATGRSCAKNIRVIFMKNGVKESFGCDKVLSITNSYVQNPLVKQTDYAFLRLQKAPQRKVLEISRNGVQDREVLTALTSTPGTGAREAHLISKSCTVHMNSMADGNFTNGLKPNIVLKNCDVVGGNSGSALVNSAGQIVGVLQANFGDPEKSTSVLQKKLMNVLSRYKYGVGTNIACVENKELDLNLQSCDQNQSIYRSADQTQLELDFGAKIAAAQARVDEQTTILKFKVALTADNENQRAQANPICIVGSSKNIPWLSEVEKKGLGKEALYSIQFPRPTIKIEINEDAQAIRSIVVEDTTLQFVIPISKIAKQDNFEFEIFPWVNRDKAILAYTIQMCDR